MERLPKEYEDLLAEISVHSQEVGYLEQRLGALSFDDAFQESLVLDDLSDLKFIQGTNRAIHRSKVDESNGFEYTFSYPGEFSLRARGIVYFDEKRRDGLRKVANALVTAILAGFFSWLFVSRLDAFFEFMASFFHLR